MWKHNTLAMPVDVKTDHYSLRYINTLQNLMGRLAQWFQSLGQHNLTEITHIPGKDDIAASSVVGFMAPKSRRC